MIHALLIVLLFPIFLRKWRAGEQLHEPVVRVSMLRMQQRPAQRPTPAPLPRPSAAPTPKAAIVHAAAPAVVRAVQAVAARPRAVPPHIARLRPSELARDQAVFAQTIAEAKAARDPVEGAQTAVVSEPAVHHSFVASSIANVPASGQGYLSPLRRWVAGDLVYYYVRYSVTYPDGTFETGIVPWPIHFPLSEDPFAHGLHSMPLPGPAADYVASAGSDMHPLVKNCYDHRYEYCPIAHEAQ